LRLRRGKHCIDGGVAVALAMRVDVAAFLDPGLGDEIAAALRIAFIPCREITDHGFVDVGHLTSPHSGLALALWAACRPRPNFAGVENESDYAAGKEMRC
jgi:hypothetical protein